MPILDGFGGPSSVLLSDDLGPGGPVIVFYSERRVPVAQPYFVIPAKWIRRSILTKFGHFWVSPQKN